jgi:hypothetical protein
LVFCRRSHETASALSISRGALNAQTLQQVVTADGQQEELAMGNSDAVPFGVTVSADNLEGARKFYTDMYSDYASITEGVFGTI